MDDIHKTVERNASDILISYADHAMASRITTQKLFEHIDFQKNYKVTERVLCFEGSKHILSPTDEYRWITEENSKFGTTTFIYGDKVAFELWDPSTIIVTTSREASEAERGRFEEIWKSALIPHKASEKQREPLSKSE